MKKILVLFFIFQFNYSFSQNLVLNGDFELYDTCPYSIGLITGYLQNVYNPFIESTSDYFNECEVNADPCIDYGHVGVPINCIGTQEAYSGKGYVGLYVYAKNDKYYREYIVLKLSSELQKDSIYTISCNVSKAETTGKATDGIMFAFVNDSIEIIQTGFGILPLNGFKLADFPIENNDDWVFLSKKYKANGLENYLVIGNFLPNELLQVSDYGLESIVCSPTFWIGYEDYSYYFIDGVNVNIENSSSYNFFPNIITPNNDGLNDFFGCVFSGVNLIEMKILNRWGETIFISNSQNQIWDGTKDGVIIEDGVYFYVATIEYENEILIKQGNLTLIK